MSKFLEDTNIECRRPGKYGLRVSVPIVGCMSFGDPEPMPCSNDLLSGPLPFFWAVKLVQAKDYQNQLCLSRTAMFNQVGASLKRPVTDYIDGWQIHRFEPNTPAEETRKPPHHLVQSGKVCYIGASSMWATQFVQPQFNGWTKFINMQNHHSLFYRQEEREMNRFCNDAGVGLISFASLP
ncbi:putative aryl-alcohol dehydrogenase [Colletotrichum chlorophyti]|uniref:Putative aryl-alcohol dehydrogenase n=1 Tax=Colletotrichum chlorophyti TaxID=708187 RepID=A0A1Q8RP06_9PEZI|nr:putative aryl-alcohol dehydrogenase [Colletotrichum chlorophyti]